MKFALVTSSLLAGDAVHPAAAPDPEAVADALGRAVDKGRYRDVLVANGWRRYLSEFDNRVISARFFEFIAPFLKG